MSNVLYSERLKRIRNAIALRPVDEIPVAIGANAFFARAQGIPLGEYCRDMELNCTVALKTVAELNGIDMCMGTIMYPPTLSTLWPTEIAVPGVDLPPDELWQVKEYEKFSPHIYDIVIKDGFEAFYEDVIMNLLDNLPARLAPYNDYAPVATKRFWDAGIPNGDQMHMTSPLEFYCGGRSLTCFFMDDLVDIPEKVRLAFDLYMEFWMKKYEKQLLQNKPEFVWIGGWRTAPELISPEMWEKFAWPYLKQLANLALRHGATPVFHLDSNWDRAIDYFKEFPKGRCLMCLDGTTNIIRAQKILDGHMCVMGDVPAQMLAFGSEQEVSGYVKNLLDSMGPIGVVISSGCDIPYNAKIGNVKAMVTAAKIYNTH